MIGLSDRNVPDAGITNEKPIWKVAFLVHDPDYGIKEGLLIRSGRPDAGRVRQDQRAGEELMFVLR
jgi:hypothetical protein